MLWFCVFTWYQLVIHRHSLHMLYRSIVTLFPIVLIQYFVNGFSFPFVQVWGKINIYNSNNQCQSEVSHLACIKPLLDSYCQVPTVHVACKSPPHQNWAPPRTIVLGYPMQVVEVDIHRCTWAISREHCRQFLHLGSWWLFTKWTEACASPEPGGHHNCPLQLLTPWAPTFQAGEAVRISTDDECTQSPWD